MNNQYPDFEPFQEEFSGSQYPDFVPNEIIEKSDDLIQKSFPIRDEDISTLEMPKITKPKERSVGDSFSKGLSKSVSGKLVSGGEKEKPDTEKPGFWHSLIEEAGTFVGDAPYFAAGTTIGAALGAPGGPPGIIAGGGFGAFALPAFLKASIDEYRNFQDKGGDLTFGEYLQSANNIADSTIKDGAFGVILGSISKAIPYLKKVPGLNKLFDNKYVGKTAVGAATVGAEAAAATTIPAATEGRLPTSEDFGKAAALITGTRTLGLPGKMWEKYNTKKVDKFNYALAGILEAENLAFPPLEEFNTKSGKAYKNNLELDKNLAQFSESYVKNLTNKVSDLSSESFPSAHDAGLAIRSTLAGTTTDTLPPIDKPLPQAPKPLEKSEAAMRPFPRLIQKPTLVDAPIVENPLNSGIDSISKKRFSSDADMGRQVEAQYKINRKEAKDPLTKRYTAMDKELARIDVTDDTLLMNIEDFIEEFGQSAAPNSPEAIVVDQAKRLLNLVSEIPEGSEQRISKAVSLAELSKTNRSIKSRPNWEVPSDYRQNLSLLNGKVDELITNTLKQRFEPLANEYIQLTNDYRMFKNKFDNDVMKIFFDKTEVAESVYDRFTKLDDFSQLSEALGTNLAGNNLLDAVRAEVWLKNLGEKPLKAKTESEFSSAVSSKSQRDFSNLMEFLTPTQRSVLNTRVGQVNEIRRSAEQSAEQYSRAKELYEVAVRDEKRYQQRRATVGKDKTLSDKQEAQQKKEQEQFAKEVERVKQENEKARKEYDRQIAALKSPTVKNLGQDIQSKQDLMVSILKDDPSKIASNMNTIEGIRRMKDATSNVKGGKDLYDSLARFETERMFDFVRQKVIDTQTVPFKDIKKAMTNKEFRAKLLELNGQEWVNSMDRLVDISDQLSEGYRDLKIKYRDDPSTLESMANIATFLGISHGELVIPTAIQVAKKTVVPAYTWWRNRKQYSQKHIKEAIQAAKALRTGNKKEMKKYSDMVQNLSFRPNEEDEKQPK